MSTVYVTKGLPACGKSSLGERMAQQNKNLRLVAKDDIRKLLYRNAKWNASKEPLVVQMRDAIIHELIGSGYDVFVHDTNLAGEHIKRIQEIASEYDAEVIVLDMTTVPVETCIQRDALRSTSVGYRVILGMAEKYLPDQYAQFRLSYPTNVQVVDMLHKQRQINVEYGKIDAIVVDIDGTLALMCDRSPYDLTKVCNDIVYLSLAKLLDTLHKDHTIIYLSGREDSCRDETTKWLEQEFLWYSRATQLFMRSAGDGRQDSEVKEELWRNHVKDNYNVIAWFDDRDQVVAHMRTLGLPVYQTNYGNF